LGPGKEALLLTKYKIELHDPAIKDQIVYVSHSQLKLYQNCPRAYFAKYSDKRETRPTPELAFGKSIHSALQATNQLKMEGGKPSFVETMRAFESALGEQKEYLYPKELITMPKEAQKILSACSSQLDELIPTAVEKDFLLSIDGIYLYGIIDLICTDEIYDYKTSWWPPKGWEADTSLQLSMYTLAFNQMYGEWPRSSQLIFLNRKDGSIQVVPKGSEARRTLGQVETAILNIKDFWANLQAGRNLAVPNYSCQWCSYAHDCPAMPLGGRSK
jgi:RecB family exonuclease